MAKKLSISIGKKFSFTKADSKHKNEKKATTPINTITIESNNSFHCENCGALNETKSPQPYTITEAIDDETTIKYLLEKIKEILKSSDRNKLRGFKEEICKEISNVETTISVEQCKSLLEAAENGNVEAVENFIKSKAEINYRNEASGNSALHLASMNGHLEVVKVLLEAGADIKVKNKYLNVALHVAAEYGFAEIVKLFLNKGVFVDIRNAANNTPLHLATAHSKSNVVEFLLKNKASVNIKNNQNQIPYTLAIEGDVVAAFIENIPEITYRKIDKENLLLKAAINGWDKVAKFLINSKVNINCKSEDSGQTPLHLAATSNQIEIVAILLKYSANVNIKNNDNETALHCAAVNSCEIVQLLHSKKAYLDVQGGVDLKTPLMIAAEKQKTDIIEYLLNNKADINKQDKKGRTALHYAVWGTSTDLDSIELLLERGADAEVRDVDGETPYSIAVLNGHLFAVLRLVARGING